MDHNTKYASSIGRKPTYFKTIVEAINFAKAKADETGAVYGVHRTQRPVYKFMARRGFHQGSVYACCYRAYPQTVGAKEK